MRGQGCGCVGKDLRGVPSDIVEDGVIPGVDVHVLRHVIHLAVVAGQGTGANDVR